MKYFILLNRQYCINFKKVILFILLIGFIAGMVSCSPAYKSACGGNKKMAIYNAGGYR